MTSKNILALSGNYFEAHPTVADFYFTSDGLAYFNAAIAQAHASHLEDKTITPISRHVYEKALEESHAVAATHTSKEVAEDNDTANVPVKETTVAKKTTSKKQ